MKCGAKRLPSLQRPRCRVRDKFPVWLGRMFSFSKPRPRVTHILARQFDKTFALFRGTKCPVSDDDAAPAGKDIHRVLGREDLINQLPFVDGPRIVTVDSNLMRRQFDFTLEIVSIAITLSIETTKSFFGCALVPPWIQGGNHDRNN